MSGVSSWYLQEGEWWGIFDGVVDLRRCITAGSTESEHRTE